MRTRHKGKGMKAEKPSYKPSSRAKKAAERARKTSTTKIKQVKEPKTVEELDQMADPILGDLPI